MLTDEYLEIDRAGKVVWSVRLDEVLDPRLDPLGILERRIEWTHTNSICQSADGTQVLFSAKNVNRVGIIDKATKQLTWRFGHPTTSGQHHARWLPNGNVHMFDNGTRREGLPFSRAIEVDPATDKVVWEYQANPPFSFFSPHVSSADRLANGNTLICEGVSGRIFEVTRRGETVWEWHNPFAQTVRGSQTSFALWRAHRYAPDHPALKGRDLKPRPVRGAERDARAGVTPLGGTLSIRQQVSSRKARQRLSGICLELLRKVGPGQLAGASFRDDIDGGRQLAGTGIGALCEEFIAERSSGVKSGSARGKKSLMMPSTSQPPSRW